MRDKVFYPSAILSRYVKYYWTCIHDSDTLELMYPSGCLEFCIDISNCDTIRHRGNQSIIVPRLEVLGHWNIPTKASIQKGNICLITRFYPYAGALFFPNQVSDFTNKSIDLHDILNKESREFYQRLMEQPSLEQKVKVLEAFLIDKLLSSRKNQEKIMLVEALCNSICQNGESFDIERLAAESGFSERYIQKLFLNYVGISPKSFFSVQRFNKSLRLVRSANMSLTNIAYECGYYDQAHFIREFRSYTGITPSQLSAHIIDY
ncbi:transcriptional regulator, AraC family [Chitinophaga rupis]|uniref:Transcriptional regulator, AraC family n=1 Tax=Chitinophaga rupis TaxID=573321 RepID=A0A1H7ZKM2_9BACT|nr:helix-turn-helix transcriptional regulator [Chitinophaga rupis]SEM58027.1 transcriptional regulator, AraC family [Chitinophaga rupis]